MIGTLTRLFGPRADDPAAYYEQNWADEEWTRGCYGSYLPARRVDRVRARRCARRSARCTGPGPSTRERWSGYMDGAVRSGEAAATAVCAGVAEGKRL